MRVARYLLMGGIVAIVVGLGLVHATLIADPPYEYTGSFRFAWSLAFIVILEVTAYGIGLPDLPRTKRSAVTSVLVAASVGPIAISMVQLVLGDALLPRFVVFGSAVLLVPWYLLCCALAGGSRAHAQAADRVVLVGPASVGALLRADLERAPEQPATVVDVLDMDAVSPTSGRVSLVDTVRAAGASVVALDRDAQADEGVVRQAAQLHEAGVRIRTLSLFYEQWLGKLPVFELERVSLMFDIGEVHRARYGRMKRVFDVAVGAGAMVVLLLLIPFVALGNLFGNRGPLFFRQPRVGRGGVEFDMLKFRTMRPGVHVEGDWTTEDDPRITSFGRVLRVTHLDELPQAIHIFRGDLSVVGPRPEQPHYVAELREKLPFYDLRHLVRPGLTGWAQVKYGYASDDSDALEKLQYDFYYLRHQNLGMDLRIVGRTIRSVVGREGR